MERKIGETFEYEGEKLKVVNAGTACDGCYFKGKSCDNRNYDITGICGWVRKDRQPVIFIKVTEEQQAEQPQEEPKEQQQEEQQPQKLNLCEILRDCPKGEMFWSPVFGDVWFYDIDQYTKRVKVRTSGVGSWYINADGTITIDKVTSPEIMLYPSRKQRDWSKFTGPWYKKERFDPHTLRPFDKVIARKDSEDYWDIDFFSCFKLKELPFCISGFKCDVLPYNDETKHLVGTTEEAPDFYRYWEE